MFQPKYGIPLFIAAAWNIIIAAVSVIDINLNLSFFFDYRGELNDPVAWFYLVGFWLAIAAFGFGYGLVAYNYQRNRAFISIGVPGKILFFAIVAWFWSQGIATNAAILLSSGDFIFALYFAYFLYQTREYGFI